MMGIRLKRFRLYLRIFDEGVSPLGILKAELVALPVIKPHSNGCS